MTDDLGHAQRVLQGLEQMTFVVEDTAEPGEYVSRLMATTTYRCGPA